MEINLHRYRYIQKRNKYEYIVMKLENNTLSMTLVTIQNYILFTRYRM